MSLRVIQRRLKLERDVLSDLANVNTYQTFVETEKAGYLIRQWIGSNLYDRVRWVPCCLDSRGESDRFWELVNSHTSQI